MSDGCRLFPTYFWEVKKCIGPRFPVMQVNFICKHTTCIIQVNKFSTKNSGKHPDVVHISVIAYYTKDHIIAYDLPPFSDFIVRDSYHIIWGLIPHDANEYEFMLLSCYCHCLYAALNIEAYYIEHRLYCSTRISDSELKSQWPKCRWTGSDCHSSHWDLLLWYLLWSWKRVVFPITFRFYSSEARRNSGCWFWPLSSEDTFWILIHCFQANLRI